MENLNQQYIYVYKQLVNKKTNNEKRKVANWEVLEISDLKRGKRILHD